MHKNKLKLIIFLQVVVIYSLGLFIYLNTSQLVTFEVFTKPTPLAADWKRASMQNIDEFRILSNKYAINSDHSQIYGLNMGLRRSERISIMILGFACANNTSERLKRTLQIWREYIPQAKIALLNKIECPAIRTVPFSSLTSQFFVDERPKNPESLVEIGRQSGPFDLIIDLGEQIDDDHGYFLELWPALRTGGYGMYSLEITNQSSSSTLLVKKLIDNMNLSNNVSLVSTEFKLVIENLLSINCFLNACSMFKK